MVCHVRKFDWSGSSMVNYNEIQYLLFVSNSLLFWVDSGTKTIERTNTDGNKRIIIVSSGLGYPTAITLNKEGNYLYTLCIPQSVEF